MQTPAVRCEHLAVAANGGVIELSETLVNASLLLVDV